MIEEAKDFREECDVLYRLLESLSDKDFEQITQFKDWTINNVVRHLHTWNIAAGFTLMEPDRFQVFLDNASSKVYNEGKPVIEFEAEWLKSLSGKALLKEWHNTYGLVADHYAMANPKQRIKWAGPDMSARSKITARLMETWAHGQEVFDLLGKIRSDRDRIKNIAQLGVNTFGWTFMNRRLDIPEPIPYVKLTAPSGVVWEWNEPSKTEKVVGSAVEFCRVVTQTRNIADTSLIVVGDGATQWMSIAQCFAGPPNDPPEPGTRYMVT